MEIFRIRTFQCEYEKFHFFLMFSLMRRRSKKKN